MPAPRPDDEPDDLLMAAYANGDDTAFERLYTRHEAGLYRFVRRLLGPALAAQADEVFQDTWMRVVRSRAGWMPQGASFRTWLFTLAHHRVIDVWRRSGREVTPVVDDGDAPWEPDAEAGSAWARWPAPHTEDIAFWRKAGERLLHCLEQLPLAQRRRHGGVGRVVERLLEPAVAGFVARFVARFVGAVHHGSEACSGARCAPMHVRSLAIA